MCSNTKNACPIPDNSEEEKYRRRCGCLKTSDKLKEILKQFPPPPPPPTPRAPPPQKLKTSCISPFCNHARTVEFQCKSNCLTCSGIKEDGHGDAAVKCLETKREGAVWRVVIELVQMVRMTVMMAALALYYLIYCYMQLLYHVVCSAIYFHNADRPMKVTIAVMTITTLLIAFQIIQRIGRIIAGSSDPAPLMSMELTDVDSAEILDIDDDVSRDLSSHMVFQV